MKSSLTMTLPDTTSTRSGLPWRQILLGVLAVAIVVYSFTANGYVVTVIGFAAIYALFCTGLNFFMGFTGQASFGQNAFAALGGYGSAILTADYSVEPAVALVLTMGFSGLVALIVGYPTLRLRGHYLAMATFALGLITYEISINWTDLTQGYMGYSGIPPLGIGPYYADSPKAQLAVIFVLLALGVIAAARLKNSRFGRACRAIAGSELAAGALGIPVARYKLISFVIAAVYASAAGSLFAHFVGFISPEVFGTAMVVQSFTMLYLGGIGTIAGPLIGAVVVSMLPEVMRGLKDFQTVGYLLLLLAILIYAPRGLHGLLERILPDREG
ncbi:branched-chain amino acid ABC transporter permease [Acidimangrovimonas sediminis]|uniref:branched-chain amino acid ABC transporter permease n=1 Tax=Acidimangrovimonas sediminis TaxID=2056283 RepID=UPI000C801F27|nr:branched-chain amino acid ABC transporter permease [Acidimangrovimonas sediminis]